MNTTAKTINPFLEEIKHLFQDSPHASWDVRIDRDQNYLNPRDACCRQYAWAIPDPDALAFVAEHLGRQAIEIGAGSGYWAWQLSQLGLIRQIKGYKGDFDILAYDIAPPDQLPNMYFAPREEISNPKTLIRTWHPVQQGGPEKLAGHPDRTLLLCWPPYASSMADECLNAYKGNRFVFIGESQGGCTGDDAFFERLDKEWKEIAEHSIKQWEGMHDHITVYQRQSE